MLTVQAVALQSLGYYELDDVLCELRRGYYETDSRSDSQWYGKACQELALHGPVESAPYRYLFRGYSPSGHVALVQNAGVTDGARARRPGFDFTFSAPKDFSILWAATHDPQERAQLLACHDAAVRSVLQELEQRLSFTRSGPQGRVRSRSRGLAFACFRHFTSREYDPQVHTHCLLANLTQGLDGKWRSLASVEVYRKGLVKELGRVYRERLADSLRREFRLLVDSTPDGFRVRGLPAGLAELFSKRRAQILDVGFENGRQAARVAQLTRRPKDPGVDSAKLAAAWREALALSLGTGFTVAELVSQKHRPEPRPSLSLERQLQQQERRQVPQLLRPPESPRVPEPNLTIQRKAERVPDIAPLRKTLRGTAHRLLPQKPGVAALLLAPLSPILKAGERSLIASILSGSGSRLVPVLTPSQLRVLSHAYRNSHMRLVLVAGSRRQADALKSVHRLVLPSRAFLRLMRARALDRMENNLSARRLFKAALARFPRNWSGRILDSRTVVLVQHGSLDDDALRELENRAERVGARILLTPRLPLPQLTEEQRDRLFQFQDRVARAPAL